MENAICTLKPYHITIKVLGRFDRYMMNNNIRMYMNNFLKKNVYISFLKRRETRVICKL